MKKYIRLISSLLLVVPVLSLTTTTLVYAQDTSTTAESDSLSADDATLLKRLAARKTEFKTKLTTADLDKIKIKCKVSQTGPVNNLSGRIKGIETSRNEVYSNILDQLNKFDTKLKEKNVSTTKLEAEIVVLKTKIATFQTDLTAYKQGIVDIKSMNCTSDPTGFKASLETVRTLRAKVAADSADIKTYITGTLRTDLKEIKTALEASEKTTKTTEDK